MHSLPKPVREAAAQATAWAHGAKWPVQPDTHHVGPVGGLLAMGAPVLEVVWLTKLQRCLLSPEMATCF